MDRKWNKLKKKNIGRRTKEKKTQTESGTNKQTKKQARQIYLKSGTTTQTDSETNQRKNNNIDRKGTNQRKKNIDRKTD